MKYQETFISNCKCSIKYIFQKSETSNYVVQTGPVNKAFEGSLEGGGGGNSSTEKGFSYLSQCKNFPQQFSKSNSFQSLNLKGRDISLLNIACRLKL